MFYALIAYMNMRIVFATKMFNVVINFLSTNIARWHIAYSLISVDNIRPQKQSLWTLLLYSHLRLCMCLQTNKPNHWQTLSTIDCCITYSLNSGSGCQCVNLTKYILGGRLLKQAVIRKCSLSSVISNSVHRHKT